MIRRIALIALRLLALAGAFAAAPSVAAPLDLPASLQTLGTASAATVVLVPPMSVHRNGLDQNGVQAQGCRYATNDRAAIAQLVALLRTARLTVNPVYQRADLREAVSFRLEDGSDFNVYVGDNAGGRLPVLGVAESTNGGDIRSVSVTAPSSLAVAMRQWAATRTGTSSGSACARQAQVAADPEAPPSVPPPPR